MVQQIVINKCYGGFGVSPLAFKRLRELGNECAIKEVGPGEQWSDGSIRKGFMARSFCYDIVRDALELLQVVRELGRDANGDCADLAIVEIPDGVEWEVEDYDGREWIAEKRRVWYAES
jgi:hypothetical protein